MEATNDNLRPSTWEKIEGALEKARERVPTLTAALLIACFCVGVGVGAMASKPLHRASINKEWRERIASRSKAVREALAAGNAEGEAADNIAIEELGIADERLSKAERAVKDAGNLPAGSDACGIDVERMRE